MHRKAPTHIQELTSVACVEDESQLSKPSAKAVQGWFVNGRREPVRIFWVNSEGNRHLMHEMPPYSTYSVNTTLRSPFVGVTASGKCLGYSLISGEIDLIYLK